MTIRHFDDIPSIRRELRSIRSECKADRITLGSIKRLLSTKQTILAAKPDPLLQTRNQSASPGKPAAKQQGTQKKIAVSALQKLTQLVSERQEKYELARHIHELVQQNFANNVEEETGAVIKKLVEFSKDLIEQTKKLYRESESLLMQQGSASVSKEFKDIVEDISSSLRGEFDISKDELKIRYYVTVDQVKSKTDDKLINRFIYIGYIEVAGFQANNSVRNLYVVVSQRKDSIGKDQYFIRTFTNKVLPATLLKTNLGTTFENADRAFTILMTSLRVDNIIDKVDPVQLPVKPTNMRYSNQDIYKSDIDEDNGVITFYLKSSVDNMDKANTALQNIFVETRKLLRTVHPRSKNTIRATTPKTKKARVNLGGGKTKVIDRYYFKIMFGKPETGATIELPRNKVKQFMDVLDIETPEAAREFNALLKNFMGINVNK